MAVEENGFGFGERGVIAVDVAPARLDHGELGVGEIGNGAREEIGGREKVRVEDGDEFAGGGFQALLQSAGFVTFTIVAMNVFDGNAKLLIAFDAGAGDFLRFIGGIVEKLDLKFIARIIELGDAIYKTFHNVTLVENRELDRDSGPFGEGGRGARNVAAVTVIIVDKNVAVDSVRGQDDEDEEIREHHSHVEGVGLVEAAKSGVRQAMKKRREGIRGE